MGVGEQPPDLVVADSVAPVGGLVCDELGIPWITTIATPFAIAVSDDGKTIVATAAGSDTLFTLDADLQNDPADIPMMLAELDKGFDVVSGWRKVRQDKALTRRLPSVIANDPLGTGPPTHRR